uniref:Uncharacterized protein n=1 Tax=Anopheles maculatus TaxID=74869 RepID=A0A182SVG5_9DIPT
MGSINLGSMSLVLSTSGMSRWLRLVPNPFTFIIHTDFIHYLASVYTSHEETRTTTDNLISSSLTLRLHLQSSHFGSGLMGGGASGSGGALLLRCTATIGKLYERYTELELGVPQRDPIPARGTYRKPNPLSLPIPSFHRNAGCPMSRVGRNTVPVPR